MAPTEEKEKVAKTPDDFIISAAERKSASVLIIEPDANSRNNMRTAVKSLGYGFITDVASHGLALERLQERQYKFVFFDSKKSNITPADFLRQLLDSDKETTAIPMSNSPRVDDVFDLFVIGAKGFLVKPFTIDSVDESMIWACKGEPIADVVLFAKDRNEALVAVMMAALDNVATLLRQSRQFETALRDLPKAMRKFMRAADLAKTFCKGSDDELTNAISEFCMTRGEGPASRLGRLRKRLHTNRGDETATPA